jgi:putative transposase
MRAVCSDLDVELVELVQFNRESDHINLLVAYPPAPAISTLLQRLKGRTAYSVRRGHTDSVSGSTSAQELSWVARHR